MAKAHFQGGSGGMSAEASSKFLEDVLAQAAQKNPNMDLSKIDPEVLKSFGQMQMVDVVTLLTPRPENGAQALSGRYIGLAISPSPRL